MSNDLERADTDIRKRAAWLFVMLAVVAGLFVLLSVTLFKTSGGGGSQHGTISEPSVAVPAAPTTGSSSAAPSPAASSGASTGSSSATSSSGPSTPASGPASSGPVPKASCPTSATCAVNGDVAGALSAINAARATNHHKAVPVTTTAQAQKCALTQGSDCPSSFVWVRVDDLSGAGVVKGVQRFNSSNDLLDNNAKSFEIGWAYDPGSKTTSCAVIRND